MYKYSMSHNICFPTLHLLIIFICIIGFSSLYIHTNKSNNYNSNLDNYYNSQLDNLNIELNKYKTILNNKNLNNDLVVSERQLLSSNNIETKNITYRDENVLNNDLVVSERHIIPLSSNNIATKIILDNLNKNIIYRDENVLYNNLVAPERRQPLQIYPNIIKQPNNIATRGIPDNYQLIGLLLRNNTESAFNLFGRQSFPGSNKWEYYVQGSMKDTNVKIPIKIKGDKEIEDKQNVDVLGSDPSKGKYIVKLYDYETPVYNPYI